MKKPKSMLLPLALILIAVFVGCDMDVEDEKSKQSSGSSITLNAPRNVRMLYAHANSLEIAFDDVFGASSYEILWWKTSSNSNNARSAIIKRNENHSDAIPYIIRNLTPNTQYDIVITARTFDGSYNLVESKKSNRLRVTTKIAAPTVRITKIKSTSIQVQFSKVDGAYQYKIYYGKSPYFDNATYCTSISTDSITIESLATRNTYYVFVEPVSLTGTRAEIGVNSIAL